MHTDEVHPDAAFAARGVSRPTCLAVAAGISCALAIGGAWAAPASHPSARKAAAGQIDLSDIAAGRGGFVINGECEFDFTGYRVGSAGDVNGDGLGDLIIGSNNAETNSGSYAGRSYVVFGKPGTAAVDLTAVAVGVGGFVILGQCAGDYSGRNVAGAGDINGDGLADLVVGAFGGDPTAGSTAGCSYVVFGKSDTAAASLSAVAAGVGGFVINGQCAGDGSGLSVAGAGDVNGDGLVDLVIGAAGGPRYHGRSYVVFGKTGTAGVDLSAVAAGGGGFIVNGHCEFDGHATVASAGDVNGDGLADLIVGVEQGDPAAGDEAGRSYVVFGKADTGAVDLSGIAAGLGGFVLNGRSEGDRSGHSVASAGDVNGDGLADVVIGTSYAEQSYLVFGKAGTAPVELSGIAVGTGGFVIHGECAGDASGGSVAGAGDIDGDGLADLIVGARFSNLGGQSYSGRSYVVFGKSSSGPVDLATVAGGGGGLAINGVDFYGFSGVSVAAAGDVNGDGLADVIVGAAGERYSGGHSYVIFGSTTGAFAASHVDSLGGAGRNRLAGTAQADALVGGAGNDTLVGLGGADVLYGGAGDDVLVVDASLATALRTGFGTGANTAQLARLDGGSGLDTLYLSGAGITLDLTRAAKPGGGTPGSSARVAAIERIDLTGSGDNRLRAGVSDVQAMAGMNLLNSGTRAALGWSEGSYRFPATVRRHQLIIDGDVGDIVVYPAGNWLPVGTVYYNAKPYTVYNSLTGRAQVLVNHAIQRAALAPGTLAPTADAGLPPRTAR